MPKTSSQSALLQAWRDLPRLREPERFVAWLLTIARNRCRDHLRRTGPSPVPLDDLPQAPATDDVGAAWEVRAAVAALPAAQRNAAALFYLRGYRVTDIAAALGVPEGTVKRRLHDARGRLRHGLHDPRSPVAGGAGMESGLDVADLLSLSVPVADRERGALSPDGARLAFPVRRPAGGGGSAAAAEEGVPGHVQETELLVMDLATGSVECITPGWGSAWCPRWSPDGTRLAFLSGRRGAPQLWLWESENRTAGRVCAEPVVCGRWFEQLRWHPDGRRILVKLRSAGWRPLRRTAPVPPGPSRPEVWLSPPPDQGQAGSRAGWWDAYRGDLALVDTRDGGIRRLTAGHIPWGTAVSPTGRHVAALCLRALGGDAPVPSFDLHIVEADGPGYRVVVEDVPQEMGDAFSFSPDGGAVALTTFGRGPGQLLLAAPDGSCRELHDGRSVDLGNEEGAPPLWSAAGDAVYCWADMAIHRVDVRSGAVTTLPGPADRSVYGMLSTAGSGIAEDIGRSGTVIVMAQHRGSRKQGLWRLGAGEPEVVVPEGNRSLLDVFLCGDVRGSRVVGPVQDAAHPPEVFLFDLAQAPTPGRQISRINPAWPSRAAQPPRLLPWRDAQGGRRLAALLLPPAHREGERHPRGWSAKTVADYWRRTIDWFDRHLADTGAGS